MFNNYYATDVGSGNIEFQSSTSSTNQVWKLEGSGNLFKIKRAQQNERINYSGHATPLSLTSGGTTWNFQDNGSGVFRISNPSNNETWDHSGGGTSPTLIIYGTTSESYASWRLFALEGVGCPSGARIGEVKETVSEIEKPFLVLAPNPAQDLFYTVLNLPEEGIVEISISDMSGRVFDSKKVYGKKGVNQFDFDVSTYSGGTYLVKAKTDKEIHSKKIVIK